VRVEVYTGFWWETLRETDHLEDPVVYGRIVLKWIFRERNVGEWTGPSWLGIETGCGNLWMR
jgi:hypothetical protein